MLVMRNGARKLSTRKEGLLVASISARPPRSGYRLDGAPPGATSELMDAPRRAMTVEQADDRTAIDPAAVAKPGLLMVAAGRSTS